MDALVAKSEMFQQKVNQMMGDEKFRFANLLLSCCNFQKQMAGALQKDLYSENVQINLEQVFIHHSPCLYHKDVLGNSQILDRVPNK